MSQTEHPSQNQKQETPMKKENIEIPDIEPLSLEENKKQEKKSQISHTSAKPNDVTSDSVTKNQIQAQSLQSSQNKKQSYLSKKRKSHEMSEDPSAQQQESDSSGKSSKGIKRRKLNESDSSSKSVDSLSKEEGKQSIHQEKNDEIKLPESKPRSFFGLEQDTLKMNQSLVQEDQPKPSPKEEDKPQQDPIELSENMNEEGVKCPPNTSQAPSLSSHKSSKIVITKFNSKIEMKDEKVMDKENQNPNMSKGLNSKSLVVQSKSKDENSQIDYLKVPSKDKQGTKNTEGCFSKKSAEKNQILVETSKQKLEPIEEQHLKEEDSKEIDKDQQAEKPEKEQTIEKEANPVEPYAAEPLKE